MDFTRTGTKVADVQIFYYANCSSCRNALAMLEERGVSLDSRDIFKSRLSVDEIRSLLTRIDRSATDVLSRRSIPYRELGLADRPVSDDELITLMAEYPALLRRPIIIGGGTSQVGFSRTALAELIESIQQGKTE